jgi:CAAX protease family protein
LSSEENPSFGDHPPQLPAEPLFNGPETQPPVHHPPVENPPWSGWDVVQIVALTIVTIFVFLLAAVYVAHAAFYRHMAIAIVAQRPLVSVVAQAAGYLLVIAYMAAVATRRSGGSFLKAIQWNFPRNWSLYIFGGVVLSLALQGLAQLLPAPQEVPMDRFFQTSAEAWVLSIFGITLAPLFEELFFRGFLYPVLARRLGMAVSVILTAAAFGLIHAPQLGRSWSLVSVIFIVGLVLTITRAVKKSVGAGFLIHAGYNGTISILMFVATSGFRHLEKLK